MWLGMVNRERLTKDNGFDEVKIYKLNNINEIDVMLVVGLYYTNNYCLGE
jgi:hypothetical protein